jgi:hypothetical protein
MEASCLIPASGTRLTLCACLGPILSQNRAWELDSTWRTPDTPAMKSHELIHQQFLTQCMVKNQRKSALLLLLLSSFTITFTLTMNSTHISEIFIDQPLIPWCIHSASAVVKVPRQAQFPGRHLQGRNAPPVCSTQAFFFFFFFSHTYWPLASYRSGSLHVWQFYFSYFSEPFPWTLHGLKDISHLSFNEGWEDQGGSFP